jgi:tol-pal system protein YbgF
MLEKFLSSCYKNIAVFFIPAFLSIFLAANAVAYEYSDQTNRSRLLDRIDRLERDLITLQKQFYRGDNRGSPSSVIENTDQVNIANTKAQLGLVEEQFRTLIGRIEQLEFQYTQLNEKIDKIYADIDFRFQEIEKKTAQQPVKLSTEDTEPNKNAAKETAKSSVQEEFDKATGLLKASKFTEAEAALSSFVTKHTDSSQAGEAYYWLGDIHYLNKNYEKSAVNFLRSYKKFPKGKKAPESLFKLSIALSNLDKKKEACTMLAKLQKEFPQEETLIVKSQAEAGKLECKQE